MPLINHRNPLHEYTHLPHVKKLGRRTAETSQETLSNNRWVRKCRGGNERRALHQGTTVYFRIHEGKHTTVLHFRKELIVELALQQLQIVLPGNRDKSISKAKRQAKQTYLVAHVHPYALIFQPTGGKRNLPTHVKSLPFQTGGQIVVL
jgi:hypothetical protein